MVNLVQVIETAPYAQLPCELLATYGVKSYVAFRFSSALYSRFLCMRCTNKLTFEKCLKRVLYSKYNLKRITFEFIRILAVNQVKQVAFLGDQIDLHLCCRSCDTRLWTPPLTMYNDITSINDAPMRKAVVCIVRDLMPETLFVFPYLKLIKDPTRYHLQPMPTNVLKMIHAKRGVAIEKIQNYITASKSLDRTVSKAMERFQIDYSDITLPVELWEEIGFNQEPTDFIIPGHPFRSVPPTEAEEQVMEDVDMMWRNICVLNPYIGSHVVPQEYRVVDSSDEQ
jgi:hypothetical protein